MIGRTHEGEKRVKNEELERASASFIAANVHQAAREGWSRCQFRNYVH